MVSLDLRFQGEKDGLGSDLGLDFIWESGTERVRGRGEKGVW
jgi:hypothetical protein